MLKLSELAGTAQTEGLELLGVNQREEITDFLKAPKSHLEQWQEAKYAADLSYMYRDSSLFAQPENLLPSYRTIVSFSVPYFQGIPTSLTAQFKEALEQNTTPPGYGRIARYAWGRDYHKVIKRKLLRLVSKIEAKLSEPVLESRCFSDSVPLLERPLGALAQLGFIGKNTMLITPRRGSYFFLAEIIWNLDIEDDLNDHQSDFKPLSPGKGCRSCTNCLTGCPTGALPYPGKLDARLCTSYLTIEKKGGFADSEIPLIGSWLFGCDICQQVCPFNHRGIPTTSTEQFQSQAGSGPFLSLKEVLAISSREQFLKRFAGTPLMRAGREGLIRNALAIIANSKQTELMDSVKTLSRFDSSEMVRTQAKRVISRLRGDD